MNQQQSKKKNLHGIVLLDKPIGLSSNVALQKVKRILRAKKAGHTGTLDPLATGLLVVCLGEATKVSAYLLDAEKRYLTTFKLGETTETGDTEGDVLEQKDVTEAMKARIPEVIEQFTGEIEQIPPMYSAIKHKGQPLYKLARAGEVVERESRTVHIHEMNLIKVEGDEVTLDIRCSKGTYIRTLAEDMGQELGCGAHVSELRRTGLGPFTMEGMVTLDELYAAKEQPEVLKNMILPIETALSDWPDVNLNDDTAYYLRMGQAVQVPQAPTQGWVRIYAGENDFLGVGQITDDGRVAPKRLVNMA